MEHKIDELKEIMAEAIPEADALLFSGGLDSSILALLYNPRCFTVGLKESPDLIYSKKLASSLGLEHHVKVFTLEEALGALPEVIEILKTFDLALPNDVAIYLGLRYAKDQGVKEMMTGDGGDELFGGYDYMLKIEDLEEYTDWISTRMSFSSSELGRALGIRIEQPYLNKKLLRFAISLDDDLKIREENGETWGKWILRKAFEEKLPSHIAWREKVPIEKGSGASGLRDLIDSIVSDPEFEEAERETQVKFINKEHLFYYRIFRGFYNVPQAKDGETKCACCGAPFPKGGNHCKICGHSIPWPGV
jgi:asparagine synthase (glutamine-hydrolysing)